MMNTLTIFSAGVAAALVKEKVKQFEESCPNVRCRVETGGSVKGIQKLLGGTNYDVMILADCSNIEEMMMPEYAGGYYVWGGNSIVAMGEGITAENWKEKLTDPDSRIKHMNPFNDPGGYRAVMAMKLADRAEAGLTDKLMNKPGYRGLDAAEYGETLDFENMGKDGYFLGYRTLAAGRNIPFAELPDEMNQGNPRYEELYNTAAFTVEGGKTVRGTTILHGIVIPKTAQNKSAAEEFAKQFISQRFMMHGFTPVQKTVGDWTIKPDNMWDEEAKYYSLMTLMEINGTNKQLDCIPLDRDDVVLDCGCGPGRVAIQAAKRVKKVICLDSSEKMLEECRKNCEAAGIDNAEYVLADWQETEIGRTIPEVDVVIQSRGGGGPTSLAMFRKAARKYAVSIIWAEGAPNLPESRQKLFAGCYDAEAQEAHPELKPFKRPKSRSPREKDDGRLYGGKGAIDESDRLPMGGKPLWNALEQAGVEYTVTTVEEGWDKVFASKQEAYGHLIQLSRYPQLVDRKKFEENVDSFLTENEEGYLFFLPTASDVTCFKVR